MNTRFVNPFAFVTIVVALIGACFVGTSDSQEPSNVDKTAVKPQESPSAVSSASRALELLKADEGTWDAAVTLWPRPGTEPIKCSAVVTACMDLGGMYLEQRFDGTFGPELGNKTWTSLSFTNFNATTGEYEAVRMAGSGSPMIVVRGKGTPDEKNGLAMELVGEYMLMGAKATERDVIRHDGPDKCIIESWMTFGDSAEFKGAEMVLTRAKQNPKSETKPTIGGSQMRLGNFSVSLTVKDIAASRAFYEKLGFSKFGGNESQNWLIMQNETATIGLFKGMFDKNVMTFNPGWNRNAETLPDFDDVREVQRMLKDRGIVLSTPADESTTGPASVTLSDPDGNLILIDQHVPSPKK